MRFRLRPNVYRQQSRKHSRIRRQCSDRPLTQPRPPIQHQHQPPHQRRPPRQPPMRRLILRQIPALQCIGQRNRVSKAERQPFTRDRVNAARRIAHQRHIPALNVSQPLHHRNRPALVPGHHTRLQPPRQRRKLRVQRDALRTAIPRNRHHANFIRAHRRDISLCPIAPMHFHKFRPGPHPIMSAHRVPIIPPHSGIEPGP